MTEETVLAIDYGTVRVGLAKSVMTLAQPLYVLANDEKVIPRIKTLCAKEGITKIIVGISEEQMAIKTRQFTEKLASEIALPVEFWDETLSSHTVHQKLIDLGKHGKNRMPIDHYAAAEILQDWLDSQ